MRAKKNNSFSYVGESICDFGSSRDTIKKIRAQNQRGRETIRNFQLYETNRVAGGRGQKMG